MQKLFSQRRKILCHNIQDSNNWKTMTFHWMIWKYSLLINLKNLTLNIQLARFHYVLILVLRYIIHKKNYIQYYIDKYLKWSFKPYIWNILDCSGIIHVKITSMRENCYSSKVGNFSAQFLLLPQRFIVLRLKIKKNYE